MANLKGKLKALGLFALGFLTGAILLGGLLVWNYTVMFRNLYHIQIISNLHTVSMIRSGHEDELLKYMESNIPQWVTFADSVLKGDARLDSLWSIQQYYETYKLNVPAEVRPILDKLLPRPPTPCELKKRKMQSSEPNAPEPNTPRPESPVSS